MHFILNRIAYMLEVSIDEAKKIMWLSLAFFWAIGAYTILKEMKDALFALCTGSEHMYTAKFISVFFLIPVTLLYSKLVDKMSRFQLLSFYSLMYGIVGVLLALFIKSNHVLEYGKAKYAWLGWFIYLFYEGLMPFVISVFWAFANSITTPDTAKKGYAIIIAGSKIGGMITSGLAWYLFCSSAASSFNSTIYNYQILLAVSSIMLFFGPYMIYYLIHKVSKKSLQGYEVAYKVEQKQEQLGKNKTGVLTGFILLFKHPYILGIFGMSFFYELINVVLGVQRIVILQAHHAKSVSAFTGSMFQQRFFMHFIGFLFAFFGTRVIVKKIGERKSLLLIPIMIGILLLYFMIAYNKSAVLIVFVLLGAINYAFASPLREALYIPTVRDIRFKSKSWIDSFGLRFSKSVASGYGYFVQNILAALPGSVLFYYIYSLFFSVIIVLWIVMAAFLGKKYEFVVKNNEIIGNEEKE